MNNNERDVVEIDLLKLLYQLWKNKVALILVTLVFAIFGYAVSAFMMTPKYSASADMIVNNRQISSEDTQGVTTSDLSASSTLVSTYSVILKSHSVIEQVIRDCNLDYSYATLSDMIDVSAVSNTQVMRVSVTSTDANEAMEIVSDLVKIAPDAIMNSIDAGSVRTTDQPWTTGKPVSPNIRRNTMIAALLGFLLYVAIVVIKEITNDKFKTPNDVRDILDYNVLGVIPVEDGGASAKKSRKNKKKKAQSLFLWDLGFRS